MTDLSPRLLDGVTSVPQTVKISLTDQSVILSRDNISVAIWPYADVYVKEDWLDEVGAILGFKNNPDASLIIQNPKEFQSILSRLSRKHRASFKIPSQYRYLFLMAIGAIAVTILIFPILSQIATFTTFLIPHSLEKKLGDVVIRTMDDEFDPCEDKEALAALNKIMNRLIKASGHQNKEVDIRLFKSKTPNAFSLPGQKIAVLSQFLNEAGSESEVAAVMAHEMGHMVKRDALEAFIESQGIGVITGLIGSSGSYGGITQFTAFMQSMDYSRKKEFMADEYGAKLLLSAGYSPQSLANFLLRTEKDNPLSKGQVAEYSEYLEFLSTHPDTKERVQRIKRFGEKRTFQPSLTPAEFARLKKACLANPK